MDRLPELLVVCEKCGGKGEANQGPPAGWQQCERCKGEKQEPTAAGRQIARLLHFLNKFPEGYWSPDD